jgi:TPR repeat protein
VERLPSVNKIYQQVLNGNAEKFNELKNMAQGGNADAQGSLARMCLNGVGVIKNGIEGVAWAQKSLE